MFRLIPSPLLVTMALFSWLIAGLFSSPFAKAGDGCSDMKKLDDFQKLIKFREARDQFIAEMHLDKYGHQAIKILKESSADEADNTLWLKDLPGRIAYHKAQLEMPDVGWEERLMFWKQSVNELERIAKCYHFNSARDPKPLMMFKLFEDEETTEEQREIYIGYLTTPPGQNNRAC